MLSHIALQIAIMRCDFGRKINWLSHNRGASEAAKALKFDIEWWWGGVGLSTFKVLGKEEMVNKS